MAVHVSHHMYYISDSGGSILILDPQKNRFRTVLSADQLHGHPLGLSVDWLYEHLYYVIRLLSPLEQVWQLWRCSLAGAGPTLVHGEMKYEPQHLQVDPYNG